MALSNGGPNGSNGSNGTHDHPPPNATSSPCQGCDTLSAIAIIGVSGRFAGDATTPSRLWDLLKEGRNALGPVPKSRFNVNGFYHPDGGRAGTSNSKGGYFLTQDVDRFDAGFFSITPEEAKGMDPVQRILLELAYEGLENAGLQIDQVANQNMSCYIGTCLHDYWDMQAYDMDSAPKYTATGTGEALMSNRISWFFNLKGPSITINTACSSSLTALHLASQSIRQGESDSALVGGFGLQLLPNFGVFMSSMSFLSADDKCHSFDSAANGYARAEGGGFVILKRLDKALQDGDTIRAVIRGTGCNQDGRTLGITQPSAPRQEELILSTYASAGLGVDETNYFEAHGTGTKVGDPIECSVIGSVFGPTRQHPIHVGSVKSNIGHLEGASGIAGLVKTIYSLETGLIAPTYGLKNVNPKIKLDAWNIDIPTSTIDWPAGLRRASINSFGYGGANAHAILDDAYHFLKNHNLQGHHNTRVDARSTSSNGSNGHSGNGDTTSKVGSTPRLFLLSSHEESGIKRISQSLQTYLGELDAIPESEDDFLHRLSYTLSEKRSNLPWKTYVAASTIQELKQGLDSAPTKAARVPRSRALTFIFTGQGAQWFAMGRSLQKYSVFQKSLQESSAYLKSWGCTWDLITELNRSAEESKIDHPSISQPACTALQLGIIDLLASWGIRPQVVIGHSSGEIAAAYAKGAFGKEAAMRIANCRGSLTGKINTKGSMAAVGLGAEAARAYLKRITMGKVVVACINSPSSVTLSGDVEGIEEVLTLLQADEVFARKLRVSTAYHSHHMESISEEYLALLEGAWEIKPGHSDVKMFSSVWAKPIDGNELGPSYWVTNLVSPVDFSGAVTAAAKSGSMGKTGKATGKRGSHDAIVEIGPHAALQGPLKQILDSVGDAATAPRYFSAIKRKQDAVQTVLEAVGELHVLGHSVDVPLVNAYADTKSDGSKISALVDLPPYAWNKSTRYWHESAAFSSYKNRNHPRLELLGARDERSTEAEPSWRNYLRTSEQPWIEQHQFQNTNIYPMAGMIVMAIEATRQVETRTDVSGYQIRNVNVRNALVVPLNETIETKLQLSPWKSGSNATSSSHWTEFSVSSRNESGVWTANCTGLITTLYKQGEVKNTAFLDEEAVANSELKREHEQMIQAGWPSLDATEFYSKVSASGFNLGPSFQGITKLHTRNYKSHFSAEVLDTKQWYRQKWEPPHLIHPAVLDVFVHVLISAAGSVTQLNARVPVSAASLYVSADFDSAPGTRYCGFTSSEKQGADGLVSDVVAFGQDGEKPVIALRGCQTVPLRSASEALSVDGQYVGHVPIIPHLSPDVEVTDAAELQKLLQGKDLMESLGHYVSLLAHKRPALDILEYNPSATSLLKEAFTSLPAGDVSLDRIKSVVLAGELDGPSEESSSASDPWSNVIQKQKLNLLEDLGSQGFQDGAFDLAISTSICEYEGDYSVMFAGFKKLLKQWGVLLIIGGSDIPAVIEESLMFAGFTSTKINISNSQHLIIAHQKLDSEIKTQNVVVITPQDPSYGLNQAIAKVSCELKAQNYTVVQAAFGNIPEQDSPYLALVTLDIDCSFLENLDDYSFSKLRSVILGSAGTLWLTLDTYSRGLVKGFGRTIRAEHPEIPFVTMALDLNAPLDVEVNVNSIVRILHDVSNKTSEESTDSEYVVRGGLSHIERLLPDANLKALMDASKSDQMLPATKTPFQRGTKALRLSFREPGLLDTSEYVPIPGLSAEDPIADGQMEIEVASVGLNFRDVMVAMGQMEDSTLGVECAGTVSRIGRGVEKFQVGDRVFGLHGGCFQTRVRVDPRTFERTPNDLSDEKAASMMCIYATAVHSLIEVARLTRGESVLIHSAAGGVGQAAIKVAQFIGAEIFVTVSSEKKKRFLVEEYGIQESHIFNSRDYSFADGILRMTKQRGVDVVLNSLAQEALRRTWLCVAPFGRFIELGKRDIYDNTGLEMRPFLNNITFSGVDILCQVTDYPDRVQKIGNQVVELLQNGAIAPLGNLEQYSFGEVDKAFRLMQGGSHIGKIVLSPRQDEIIPVVPEGLMTFQLPHDRTYILVGGLGGVGRSIAKMLVEKGARNLVFLSRSGSSRLEAATLLSELQSHGVLATAISVDVADKPQLEVALAKVGEAFPLIQGVIHCAMDLRDGIYENMSASDWNLSLRPKLRATRNLHELLPKDLGFFVCLSSIAGIIGSRGQANYNAGNTYQDALMHHRAASGLAATSINLSLVVGIGVSTERDEVFQLLKNGGLLGMDEVDVLNVVAAAVSGRAPTQVAMGPSTGGQLIRSSHNDPYWFADSRFAIHSRLGRRNDGANSSANATQDFKKLLAAATSKDEFYDIAFAHLVAGVSKIIKMDPEDVDTRKSLPALGIDSLIAIEIRTWISKEFQADVSVFDIVSSDPLPTFAKKLIDKSSLIPASRD